jgi:hypothetical protein
MSVDGLRGREIPSGEVERYRDAEWALGDPEVQQRYAGQWVVAYQRRVLASGPSAATALEGGQPGRSRPGAQGGLLCAG